MKRRLAVSAIIAASLACWLSLSAFAATITLRSGNASIGEQDPLISTYLWGDEANKQRPWVVPTPTSTWPNPLDATTWISSNANSYSSTGGTLRWYVTTFTLPAGYMSPSMDLTWMADYYGVYILLNDHPIVGRPADFNTPTTYTTDSAAYFNEGANVLKLLMLDDGGNAGIDYIASVNYDMSPQPPVNVSLDPRTGTIAPGTKTTFTSVYSDPNTYTDLSGCCLLLNTTTGAAANSVYLLYNPVQNKLYLRNDAGTTYTGGYAPGSANVLENSQCKVYCADTTVEPSDAQLTVNWAIELKPTLSCKTLSEWMYVMDKESMTDGWEKMGSLLVLGSAPATGSISPSSGSVTSGTYQTFTSQYSDLDGSADIAYAYVLMNQTVGANANSVYAVYNQKANRIYLRNDANTGWLGGFAPGTAGTISNSQCTINCANTTVSGSGSNLTIDWSIQPKLSQAGASWMEWMMVTDKENLTDGWNGMGTVTVQ